ncbi:MAG: hypothetical protein ABFS43_19210 [Thermodesulfobacteriota bacterium]
MLFLNEDRTTNALNAVSTAQTIQDEAACISAEISSKNVKDKVEVYQLL